VSRESAPRSTNLASADTAVSSVPSCSLMMVRTLVRVSGDCRARRAGGWGEEGSVETWRWYGGIVRAAAASSKRVRQVRGSARGSACGGGSPPPLGVPSESPSAGNEWRGRQRSQERPLGRAE